MKRSDVSAAVIALVVAAGVAQAGPGITPARQDPPATLRRIAKLERQVKQLGQRVDWYDTCLAAHTLPTMLHEVTIPGSLTFQEFGPPTADDQDPTLLAVVEPECVTP